MKRVSWIVFGTLVMLAVVLFILHLRWERYPRTARSIYILDKTVINNKFEDHKSLFWVLSNLQFQKPDGNNYQYDQDYYGFFPIDPALGTFDFRTIRLADIDLLADSLDMVYYVDCYGVYSDDWAVSKNTSIGQKVYGGLNQNDYLLLKGMKERGKLIIAEHDLFSSSGGGLIKEKLSDIFGFLWTGWVGRSFSTFDTSKTNGPPRWIVKLYESEHGEPWPKDDNGVILIRDKENVVLLINGIDIVDRNVFVVSTQSTVERYGVEQKVPFSGWFEIVETSPQFSVFSTFTFNLTSQGSSLLRNSGIPESFPAAFGVNSGCHLYYFAGDFSHTPVYMITSKMAGGGMLNQWLSFITQPVGCAFFNSYYYPFLSHVLKSYTPTPVPVDSLGITN